MKHLHVVDNYSTLSRILQDADISSYCLYILFGYYDAIIRIWATGERRRRLIRGLRELAPPLEDALEFHADAIHYLWKRSSEPPDPSRLLSSAARIETVLRTEEAGEYQDPNRLHALHQLQVDGLIHWLPPTEPTNIKFYLAFQPTGSVASPSTSELNRLTSLLSGTSPSLDRVSIFEGTGAARYLVKASSAGYRDLVNLSYKLADPSAELGLRPMTLPILSIENVHECDSIDAVSTPDSQRVRRLLEAFPKEMAGDIQLLPAEQLDALFELFHQYAGILLSSPFAERFTEIIRAGVKNDPLLLTEKLSFLHHLESLFRRYAMARLWSCSAVLGTASWHRRLLEIAAEREPRLLEEFEHPANPRQWTLMNIYQMVKLSAEVDPAIGQKVTEEIDPEWRQVLPRICALRNNVSHGNLFEEDLPSDMAKGNESLLGQAFASALVYNRLSLLLSAASMPRDLE